MISARDSLKLFNNRIKTGKIDSEFLELIGIGGKEDGLSQVLSIIEVKYGSGAAMAVADLLKEYER